MGHERSSRHSEKCHSGKVRSSWEIPSDLWFPLMYLFSDAPLEAAAGLLQFLQLKAGSALGLQLDTSKAEPCALSFRATCEPHTGFQCCSSLYDCMKSSATVVA